MSRSLAPYFRKSLKEHWSMRFRTRHPDGDNYDGIVIAIGRDFVVVREEIDFEFNGMVLLRKGALRGVRDGRFEACTNEILQRTRMSDRLRAPTWVTKCATVEDFVAALMKRSIWPGIEMLFSDGSTAFYLGPVKSVSELGFVMKCYDAAGKWEKDYFLRWSEIFRIEVGSRYCRHFNRYMQAKIAEAPCPPLSLAGKRRIAK